MSLKGKTLCIILGTRPEIIKLSPVLRELARKKISHFVIHTGQHYDFMMNQVFFEEFGIHPEMISLDIGSGSHGETTGRIMVGVEIILKERKPACVLVQGDTNSVLAGSLTACKMHIPVGHIEAGLRSYDRRLPEEYNRIACDHLSRFLFAPTRQAIARLSSEGIGTREILYFGGPYTPLVAMTGNTIVDALVQNHEKAHRISNILSRVSCRKDEYILATFHREENVDHHDSLQSILLGLHNVSHDTNLPLIVPLHPRTKKRLEEFHLTKMLESIPTLQVIDPVGFFDMLVLERNARLILTDSGGIQEEACSLKVPCVVLRDRTDRPEIAEAGAAVFTGTDEDRIRKGAAKMMTIKRNWRNPFGDGKAAQRIVSILSKEL